MKEFAKLLQTGKTVFTTQDLYQIFSYTNLFSLRNSLSKLGKKWLLVSVKKWIWALPKYNSYELANILEKPSYISLETVLVQAGIVFQEYGNTIFSISTKTRELSINNTQYQYKTIKKEILFNPIWIYNKNWYAIASLERAICDRLYLTPKYYFDNLRSIDWDKVLEIAEIYQNKRLILDIIHAKNDTQY